jgi:hypothetical protein
MTNLQLLLAIGVPTLAVIASMILNNGRFNTIEGRIASMDTRLINIEGDLRRFYQEQGRLAGHVESLEQRNR